MKEVKKHLILTTHSPYTHTNIASIGIKKLIDAS